MIENWFERSEQLANRIYQRIPESALAVNRSMTTGVAVMVEISAASSDEKTEPKATQK